MRRGVFLIVPALILGGLATDAAPVSSAVLRPSVANLAVIDSPEPALSRRPPPIIAASLPEPRVVLAAVVSQPVVALTFDLDMTSQMAAMARAGVRWVNSDAIGYMRANKIHATLFMTGMWAELYPAVARQLATDPNFEIGNHSYSHPAFHAPCYRLSWVSRASQAQQITFAQQAIQRVTGITPRYFRFPGGCYDRQALDLVHASGLIPVEWNVNSIDAFNPHSQQIASIVVSSVEPGSIVVMHLMGGPNAPGTSAALRLIVPGLQRKGYRFVTIGELLAAGTPIQPTDPREVVEFYQPQPTTATVPIAARRLPTPVRHCSWVHTKRGWVYICG